MQRSGQLSTSRPKGVSRAGLVLLVCLALALPVAPAGAERRVEVYKARYRPAEELIALAQAVMADDGDVALDPGTNSLVLIGDPRAISEVLALFASEDRRLRSVRLRYDTRRARELIAQGFQVRWTASTGSLRLGNVRTVPDSDPSLETRANGSMRRLVESIRHEMRVVEGETTRIETGTLIPYAMQGPSGGSTEFVNVTTGVEAKPRILADGRVQVDLAAFAHQFGLDRSLDAMKASTLVIVKPGALVVVGSLDEARTEKRADKFDGSRSHRRVDETVLLLRVDID